MADVITRFKLETTQYDSKLRDASKGLADITRQASLAGSEFGKFTQKDVEAARALGSITPSATNAKDKVKELVGAFNDVARAYNALTKEQQQSDFGKAMADSLKQLKTQLTEAKQELYDLGNAAEKVKGGGGLFSGDNLSGMLQVFGGNLMTKAAGAAMNFASEIGNAVTQGIELAKQGEGIRMAFERLGRGDILDGLREATHGTVTDLELMKAAVKFNDFKLPVEELGTMLAFAQQKAKDTGQSVDYMVDSIVTGLARKSLMILDNLGLSAAEIKEKMKETGDMTKAVGEIIREQMAKAGDYVETAADRAQQANVSLQNKMEELGRKFAPLQEASNNMWTSMKIGILDIIGGPLTTLINKLTEAGRLANAYGILGGNAKVGRMVSNLQNANEGNRQSVYQQQQAEIWKYINRRENYMKDRQRWVNNQSDEGLRQKLISEQEAFGTNNVNEIKAQIAAAKKLLADYQQAAKTILSPEAAAAAAITSITNTKGGKGGNTKNGPTYDVGSLAEAQADVQRLTKLWNEAGADVRDQYLQPLIEAEQKVKDMQNAMTLAKDQAQGKLNGVNLWQGDIDDITGGKAPQFASTLPDLSKALQLDNLPQHLSPLQQLNAELARLKELLELAPNTEAYQAGLQAIADKEKEIAQFKGTSKLGKDAESSAKSFQMAANAISQVGSAMSTIEDPTMKIMGIVAQAVASVALGFSQATTAEAGKGVYAWIAAIAGGMATMYSTIESIHSATGYAEGGIIKGNSYSGDKIGGVVDGSQFIGLNAGELVLNASQQSMLASNLQNGGGGKMEIVGVLSGENVVLMADRWGRRTGRGELLFGKNL